MDITAVFDKMDTSLLIGGTIFLLSLLFALYSIALVNKRVRLIYDEIKQLSEDNKLINESILFLQTQLQIDHGKKVDHNHK